MRGLEICTCVCGGTVCVAELGSEKKVAACAAMGADIAINYRTEDFVERVKGATNLPGKGVDVLLDMVCGPYFDRNLRIMNTNGR